MSTGELQPMTRLMRRYLLHHRGMKNFGAGVSTGVNRCQWCLEGSEKGVELHRNRVTDI